MIFRLKLSFLIPNAPLIREAFDLILAGASILETIDHLNNKRDYKTVKRINSGGKEMARTTLYEILRNPFYTGYFRWNGDLKKGSHPALITFQEHRNVIERIEGTPSPRPKGENVPLTYRGVMTCGHCTCLVTGEIKHKKERVYTYYHCTHRKKTIVCKQPSITEDEINQQAIDELSFYNIHPQFLAWAKTSLNELEELESKRSDTVHLRSKSR